MPLSENSPFLALVSHRKDRLAFLSVLQLLVAEGAGRERGMGRATAKRKAGFGLSIFQRGTCQPSTDPQLRPFSASPGVARIPWLESCQAAGQAAPPCRPAKPPPGYLRPKDN